MNEPYRLTRCMIGTNVPVISVINIRTHKEISLFLMDFLYEVENHCLLCLSKTALRSLSTPASEQKETNCFPLLDTPNI